MLSNLQRTAVVNPLLSTQSGPLVIAHRGNSAHAPENTIEAFRQAIALGADGIEFDVRLTRDGRAIVMHDPAVDRTTSGTGLVADLTYDRIRTLDAGARFAKPDAPAPYAGRGVYAPLLEDVLDAFPSTPCIIELKTKEAAPEVLRIVRERNAAERCVVGSFVDDALAAFEGTGLALSASTRQLAALLWRGVLRRGILRVPFQCVSTPRSHRFFPLPIAGWTRVLEPLGVPVHVWTIDDPAVARRLWRKGVRGILTNDVPAILAARSRPTG
ncbi:MAG: Glycerophosphodiester phosphodiesterase [Gemmatimonadaceae bacterium]|nr:Glycerophosphodiester phosphodiesterase [Gemmatimonadaceae bacterium]